MTGKLRGLQLFRHLIWRTQASSSSCASPPPCTAAQPDLLPQCARAFSAQPARDLASEDARFAAAEPTARQLKHEAHYNLVNALSGALVQAHSGHYDKETGTKDRSYNRRHKEILRILREFAPMKLVLSARTDEESKENLRMLRKWLQQLELEWSTVTSLREKYSEHAKSISEMGRGQHLLASQTVMKRWFPGLVEAIRAEQEAVRHSAQQLPTVLQLAHCVTTQA